MRYPEFIKPGDKLGFAAPSMGCTTNPYKPRVEAAIENLRKKGFSVETGPNVFRNDGVGISASPKECAEELMAMYLRDDIGGILAVGGGELMCEILDYMDFEAIKNAPPKWYTGYSDNTNFSFLSATLADTAAFYGIHAGDFGMEPWHESVRDAYDMLLGRAAISHGYGAYETWDLRTDENPLATINGTEPTEIRSFFWDGQPFSGRFIGGCLDCLITLCGTKFDRVQAFREKYKDEGIIWFIESCDLGVFGIRRAVWELKEAGWFEHAKAVLVGRPLCMGSQVFGLDQYDAVLGPLKDMNIPVIMDIDIGHIPPIMPMVNGGYGTVMPYGNKNIQILWEKK